MESKNARRDDDRDELLSNHPAVTRDAREGTAAEQDDRIILQTDERTAERLIDDLTSIGVREDVIVVDEAAGVTTRDRPDVSPVWALDRKTSPGQPNAGGRK